jgi:hypothetical protein
VDNGVTCIHVTGVVLVETQEIPSRCNFRQEMNTVNYNRRI